MKVHETEGRDEQKSRRPEDIRWRLTEHIEELHDRESWLKDIAIENEEEVEEVYLRPVLLETDIEKAIKEKNRK